MDRNRDFKGRIGIVTGAASGIGAATATVLARRGAHVIVADINASMLNKVAEAISHGGGKVSAVATDVSREDQVRTLVSKTLDVSEGIDFLVNSAAILARTAFVDLKPEEWDFHMNINLRGAYLTCGAVVPHMIRHRGGAPS